MRDDILVARNAVSVRCGGTLLFLCAVVLLLTGGIARAASDSPPLPVPMAERLGGEERFLPFLSTDKPVYRSGETVYARAVALRADNYLPMVKSKGLARLVVTGPKGDEVAVYGAEIADSVAGFSWTIPDGMPGGRYTAAVRLVTGGGGGSAVAARAFEIRAYNPPRLKSQIEFLREGYGPGDSVDAVVTVARAEGGAPVGAKVTAVARVDGDEVARVENLAVDADGGCRASFTLPDSMERGEGTLAFLIEDGGVIETAAKTIPILLQTLDISFYPEGGDLVAGLPGRVYVQARRTDGKPADIRGEIVPVHMDGTPTGGKPVATLSTEHEGRGFARFTPESDGRYALRLLQPSGIKRLFPLPAVKDFGAVVMAEKDAYAYDEPVTLAVYATRDSGAARVTLFHREREAASATVIPGENNIELTPDDVEGVLMATVWDADGKPLAERLVFRKPKFAVSVAMKAEVVPDGGAPTPGGKVRLTVEAKDENGRPVEAVVGVTVTDDAILEMVETRDQAPNLPVMVYLENEVADLADARVYFDPKNPDADRDIDLLLGTQGWRRFILVSLDDALAAHPDAAERALAVTDPELASDVLARAFVAGPGYEVPFREGEPMPPTPPGMSWTLIQKPAEYDTVTETVTIRAPATFQVPVPGEMTVVLQEVHAGPSPDDAAERVAALSPPPDLVATSAIPAENALPPRMDEQNAPMDASAAEPSATAAKDQMAFALPEALNIEKAPSIPEAQTIPFDRGAEKKEATTRRVLKMPAKMVWRMQVGTGSFTTVREYAHAVRADRRPNDRVDFTETLYWNAGVRTNPRDGKASVTFDLSDSVTTFRVHADAFGNNGALGAGTTEIASVEPFHLEAKMPPAVIMGDRPILPVALVNATATELERVGLAVRLEGMDFTAPAAPERLAADSRERVLLRLSADRAGEYSLGLNAAAGGYADNVARKMTVLPRGFPVQETASGMAGPDLPFFVHFTIAGEIVPGSMKATATLYPTPLANMEQALNALLRRPHGCFEQTSSTNFPLVMAQQYFMSHDGVSPETVRRAADLLDEGYRKLLGFECPNNGYEWYGKDPGQEALTAYGLMQFMEMRRVMSVDEAMLSRTREWLLSRRDGDGGFRKSSRGHDSFGKAPDDVADTYILWTLLESGEKPGSLDAEIAAARKRIAETADPYILALGVNIFHLADDTATARRAATKLIASQGEDGNVTWARTSITRSGGVSLEVETTSLAVLAWLRCGNAYAMPVERAMAWLFEHCKDGRFGSTQSTILALKAINAYDAARAAPKGAGSVQLVVDGHPFGSPVAFDGKTPGAMQLPDFTAALPPGRHTVEVVMTGGGRMPVSLEVSYNTPQPVNSPECPLLLKTALSAGEVAEGEPVDLRVTVSAPNEEVSMPLAVIGLPAGLEPRHERLKELAAEGRIASYEIIGRELVLYWRGLKAGETVELSLPMVANIPGTYTAPASRVYAYYLDEHIHWAAGETIRIEPK